MVDGGEVVDLSANILKKSRGQVWEMQFGTENNEEYSGEAAPDVHFEGFSRVGEDAGIKENWGSVFDKIFSKRPDLENRLLRSRRRLFGGVPLGSEKVVGRTTVGDGKYSVQGTISIS